MKDVVYLNARLLKTPSLLNIMHIMINCVEPQQLAVSYSNLQMFA